VQRDVDEALGHYGSISDSLALGLWEEFQLALGEVQKRPQRYHRDRFAPNFRRVNLKRFPYIFLYVEKSDRIRVQVLRHNQSKEGFGTRRRSS